MRKVAVWSKADTPKGKGHVCDINYNIFYTQIGVNVNPTIRADFNIEEIKPYLFPLSSMTGEQRKEFLSVAWYERRVEDCGRHTETYYYDMVGHEYKFYPNSDAIDWFNAHHYDHRDLIEMGLAIDATKLNIYWL